MSEKDRCPRCHRETAVLYLEGGRKVCRYCRGDLSPTEGDLEPVVGTSLPARTEAA